MFPHWVGQLKEALSVICEKCCEKIAKELTKENQKGDWEQDSCQQNRIYKQVV